jgi:CheY-like chemotaxis protein
MDPFIRVEMNLPQNGSSVEADLTQMQMVLSSVLTNASEALSDNGIIKISVQDMEIEEKLMEIAPDIQPGPHVCLTIEDNGKGMDEESIRKVFDPFYSTKFHGRGLSMAAAYGIVKNHHGTITIDSELNKGTKVRIYLPMCHIPSSTPSESISDTMQGTGTVLVIEDDESVMDVTRAFLERAGYSILQAKTGREAVDIVKKYKGDIDSAILDIGLPDMGGEKVYAHLKEARPDLKVIVCSGYSSEGIAKEILSAGAQGFIQKPFSLKTISAKLNEIMKAD